MSGPHGDFKGTVVGNFLCEGHVAESPNRWRMVCQNCGRVEIWLRFKILKLRRFKVPCPDCSSGVHDVPAEFRVDPKKERRTDTFRARDLELLVEQNRGEKYPEDVERPKTRGECSGGPRPCPFLSCRHHLYLDVTSAGSLVINHPNVELEDMVETCSLDVAERGYGLDLKTTGLLMNVTHERVRQIEDQSLKKLYYDKTARELNPGREYVRGVVDEDAEDDFSVGADRRGHDRSDVQDAGRRIRGRVHLAIVSGDSQEGDRGDRVFGDSRGSDDFEPDHADGSEEDVRAAREGCG